MWAFGFGCGLRFRNTKSCSAACGGIKSAMIPLLGAQAAKDAKRPQQHPDGKRSLVQDVDNFCNGLGGFFFFEVTGLIEKDFPVSSKDTVGADIADFIQAA